MCVYVTNGHADEYDNVEYDEDDNDDNDDDDDDSDGGIDNDEEIIDNSIKKLIY